MIPRINDKGGFVEVLKGLYAFAIEFVKYARGKAFAEVVHKTSFAPVWDEPALKGTEVSYITGSVVRILHGDMVKTVLIVSPFIPVTIQHIQLRLELLP